MLIAQLTDLHVCARGRPASRVSETNMFAERAFRAVAAAADRPDVVLLTGDLTENGLAAEYRELAGMLRRFPLPVFVIPGNHDRRGPLREHLGDLPLVCSDPTFVHYVVEDHPLRLVMLDTLVPGGGHGELCDERLRFLDRALAAAPERPTMVAMHHPPFRSGIVHMDEIALRDAERFAAVIARHRQVERIVCGHVHRTIFARLAHAIVSVAPSVAHQVDFTLAPDGPAGLIFEPPAYHFHRWTPQTGVVTHMVYVDQFRGPFPFVSDNPSS
jgi:3',5'-cyclic-AMP phosphodiesterase